MPPLFRGYTLNGNSGGPSRRLRHLGISVATPAFTFAWLSFIDENLHKYDWAATCMPPFIHSQKNKVSQYENPSYMVQDHLLGEISINKYCNHVTKHQAVAPRTQSLTWFIQSDSKALRAQRLAVKLAICRAPRRHSRCSPDQWASLEYLP